MAAAQELKQNNISTRVINIHTIKPLDKEIIIKAANETGLVVTIEEHQLEGGFGESVASAILEGTPKPVRFKRIGIEDVFCSFYGTYPEVKGHYNLTKENLIHQVKLQYKNK
jgi:transketolase